MFKVGDKVVVKKDNVYLFTSQANLNTEPLPYCKKGDVFIIEKINDNIQLPINISNDSGFTWVDENEIESLRELKLKKILCID